MKDSFNLPQSEVVKRLPPSGIRTFFDLVLGMDDVISLGVGEPDFVTPWQISQYAIEKIQEGHTSYASNSGLMELRKVISARLEKEYALKYCPENEVIITVGVSEAMDLALRAILNPGDEVLIHEPCYVSYSPCILLAGGKVKVIETSKDEGFKVTPQALEASITEKTKAFVFNYPCNPTGATYTREELMALAKVIKDKNILLISDEIYYQLSFDHDHVSIASLPDMADRVLYLNGFSKGYAMTGWRVGYACGPEEIIQLMLKIHQYTILCVPIMSQFAAIEALLNGDEAVQEMKEEYAIRRNLVVKRLNEIGLSCHRPGGAFYVFPEVPKFFESSEVFASQLLKEEKVAVVPGSAFGKNEYFIRISYASSLAKLEMALDRMGDFVDRHR